MWLLIIAPPCESLSMMDPPLPLVSALIMRDGCFELNYKSECRIILSHLVYPLMANEMGNEMGNLLSLTAVLFHGYYSVVYVWKEQWWLTRFGHMFQFNEYSNAVFGASFWENFRSNIVNYWAIRERARSKAKSKALLLRVPKRIHISWT